MIGTDHIYKRFQVFLSSTFIDLKEERQELGRALNKNNYILEGMELFPAANKRQWEIIKERIAKSDIYVLVIAERFGSIANIAHELEPSLVSPNELISYTKLEFRYAKSIGLPILAFIKNETITDGNVEQFVREVQQSDLTTDYWMSKLDLVTSVLAGLKEIIQTDNFSANNGWIKTSSLSQPINSGHKSVFFKTKFQYVKLISYSDKRNSSQPLYKKYVTRLNKEVEVYDEYVTLTVHHLSHYVDAFQYYMRTDGDAIDFSSILPFLNKFTFSDVNAGAKDTIFNPVIKSPSNIYTNACSFYNGFQFGNMDLAVKATKQTKHLILLVDFTSIPGFKTLFEYKGCVLIDENEDEMDLNTECNVPQEGIYMVERYDVAEDQVLKLKFGLIDA